MKNLADSLDLRLSNIKVGDELTVIIPTDAGLEVKSAIYLVHIIESWRVLVRRPDKTTNCGSWQIKNKGGCPYAMHDQDVMRYYYSANPAHIMQAKAQMRALAAKRVARDKAFEAQMVIARPIGEVLGDGWVNNSDEGSYYSTAIAHELAERLTSDQMKTLAEWLKISS